MTTRRRVPSNAWPKGVSGNPAGRKPGSGQVARLRAAIADHVPTIIERLTEAALAGDVGAARLLLERAVPALRAVEEPAPLALPNGSFTEQGRAILHAVAGGTLAPGQGSSLLTAIGTLARLVELDELEQRVRRLEGGDHAEPKT